MPEPVPSLRATIHHLSLLEVGNPENSGDYPQGPILSTLLSDPTYFALSGFVYLQIDGGVDGFTCLICSPRWLLDHFEEVADSYSPEGTNGDEARWRPEGAPIAFFSPGMVLMSVWSEQVFVSLLNEILDECTGPDWPSVGTRLSRFLVWEWDYKYDEYVDAHPEQFR